MRALSAAVLAALLLPAWAAGGPRLPSSWLAQAMCVHRHEGPWAANTGNGYFGGMQIALHTWRAMGGSAQPALEHPGDPAYPFAATKAEQLHVAWRIWLGSGRKWTAWNAVGALCAHD